MVITIHHHHHSSSSATAVGRHQRQRGTATRGHRRQRRFVTTARGRRQLRFRTTARGRRQVVDVRSATLVSDDDTWWTLDRRFRSVTRGTVTVGSVSDAIGQRQRGTVTVGQHYWSRTCIESVVKWYCRQPRTPSPTADVVPVSCGLNIFGINRPRCTNN